jgi:hypothetical protein
MVNSYWKLHDPLFDSLPNYDKDQIQALTETFKAGDDNARDELLMQLLALCRVILQKQLYKIPSMQRHSSDLVSILTLRTCEWVANLRTQPVEYVSVSKYFCQVIKQVLVNFNIDDNNPNVTGNYLRKKFKNGDPISLRLKLRDDLLTGTPTQIIDLKDTLLTLAVTNIEQKLIILRAKGYTYMEIATNLGISKTTVYRIRRDLEQRYLNFLQKDS